MPDLLDFRMRDGSRHFAELPCHQPPFKVHQHASQLKGANVRELVGTIVESWIEFDYKGQHFSIHNPTESYWFFVEDPGCSDDLLREVVGHFESLLGRTPQKPSG